MAKISINLADGSLASNNNELIIGIDLGTTNSLVAYMDRESGRSIAVKNVEGTNKLVPSVIHFADDNKVLVGREAKSFLSSAPERTIYSVKRLMGKSLSDLEGQTDFFGYRIIDQDDERLLKVKVGDRFYSPIELSALILRELKQRVELALKDKVKKAVITVPAYFNDSQRQATRDAGKLAGLEVLRIVNEPTAASLAYGIGLDPTEKKTVAVYDLGGGTFDISLLKIQQGVFEVLATNGDTFLGGDDFDQAILNHWIKVNGKQKEQLRDNKQLGQQLRLLAEKAKVEISNEEKFAAQHDDWKCELSRALFEQLIAPLVAKTMDSCKAALKDASLSVEDVDEVVLVGGSTRVPAVKRAVMELFGKEPKDDLDPDEIVALGASIQADILSGNKKDLLLLDVTPLSLGIETMGGLMDVIIPRNTKVPTKAGRQYTTQVDGQANMRISIFQGERDQIAHNRKLGEFSLTGIPAMPAGLPKVDISFILDADGILQVKAKELRSNIEQSIQVKPQYGVTEQELAKMLKDSILNAETDMKARALQEAKNEARMMADTTVGFLAKHSEHLSEEEIMGTEALLEKLRGALEGNDKDQIQAGIVDLNDFTRPFAERVMDLAVSKAMKGKKI